MLFSLFVKDVHIIPPYTLSFPTFAISIEQACSGLDSIFLFTALYGIIWLIDWNTLDTRKMALIFIPALIGTIIVNIIRVFILILVGLTISPELAGTLFHTYLGMILFIIYFAIYWKFLYKWLLRRV
jgi:exosortase/archaeosortase family protein